MSHDAFEIAGTSPALRRALELAAAAARSDAPVLVLGESGTGKELVARAVHRSSPRARGPFVAINCAAIPEGLLEAELFGHRRGAWTGADRDREGLLREAHRGTLFLDEVGDMPLAMQAKLLRALESGEVRPLGGGVRRIDVRVVAATHRDLRARVQAGLFREDLWWRLAVFALELPPLRARGDDALLLAERFLRELCPERPPRLSDGARARLLRHAWPGNVRELRNAIRRVAALGAPVVEARDLAFLGAPRAAPPPVAEPESPLVDLRALERREVERARDRTGGHVRQAAALLGVHPATLYRKLKRWAS